MNRKLFLWLFGTALSMVLLPLSFPGYAESKVHTNTEEKTWNQIKDGVEKLEREFHLRNDELAIIIDPSRQKLYVIQNRRVVKTYPVSTSPRGLGNVQSSYKTPTGTHRIKEKIGDGVPIGTIFKGRENTGRIAQIENWRLSGRPITTRILWLDGEQPGFNKGGTVDTFSRYIYIHGTAAEYLIGKPASIGCILMKNADVIELFDMVSVGTLVEILNKPYISR